jgi:hypothetical protein
VTEGFMRTIYKRIKEGSLKLKELQFKFEDGFPSGHKHALREFLNQINVEDWFGA